MMKVGIIGVGSMGENHVRVLSNLKGVDFIGFYDISETRTKEISEKYDINGFSSRVELLSKCDCVIIATPTTTHYDIAKDCLLNDKKVLVEKPVCDDINKAKKLVELAKEKNLLLGVGHVEEYNPVVIQLQKILDSEKILAVECSRVSPYNARGLDVDVATDLMIHDLGIIIKIINSDIKKIEGMGIKVFADKMDMMMAHILFDNGIIASLIASKISQQKIRKMTVTCKEVVVIVDYMSRNIELYREKHSQFVQGRNNQSYKQEMFTEKIFVPTVEPLKEELEDFIKCAKNNTEMRSSGEYAVAALEAVHKLKSAIEK